ncbi:hypothetical protein C8Q80DRAFT_1153541 [Daedaleopsis nitida]|nr:hypothetical protein C8Q80DRAFT_1153541 [Daedaleopsis nitida]
MAPRRKCPVCGSKQWHKEPQSGLITCSEGHVLQNYRNETREVNELGPHAVRKRTLKSGRKKQAKLSRGDPKLYHGERARYHYFQCLQVVLRMQVAALAQAWKLPPEFEKICRDIWALHLSLLPSPPVAEPLLHLRDGVGAEHASKPETAGDRIARGEEGSDEDASEGDAKPFSSPSSSESESDDLDETELEKLMRENSDSPSEDEEGEHDGARKDLTAEPVKKKKRTFGEFEVPASTVSVLVLACWTLRLPVMYMDFIRLIESYELPYLDAPRLLPETMVRHLRKQTLQALSPYNAPTPVHLHELSSRLARLLYSTYDIYTPEMNAAPILWKAIGSLQGSPNLYVMTKKFARVVSLPLTLHRSLVPELMRTKKKDPKYHKPDSAIPEVTLVAAVIVVLRMVYGLDGKLRQPRDAHDPACALPILSELLGAIQAAERAEAKHPPVFAMDTGQSVLDMDDTMLDAYLQFCEKALLPRESRMPPRNATTDHFPLQSASSSAIAGQVGDNVRTPEDPDMRGWSANSVSNTEAALKPGEQYAIYNNQDILGSLPDDMELVISKAAKWAGVDTGYVSGVVERFERRVIRWWDRSRKKATSEQLSGTDSE